MPIPALVAAGLVTGGSMLANSLTQQAFYDSNLEKQVDAQKHLSKFNSKLNYEQWAKQVANMDTLMKQGAMSAGLSTANMENSQVAFGSAGSNGASVGTPFVPNTSFDINAAALTKSQVDLNKALENEHNKNADLIEVNSEAGRQQIAFSAELQPWVVKGYQSEILQREQLVKESMANVEKIAADTKLSQQQFEQNLNSFPSVLRKLVADADFSEQEVSLYALRSKLLVAQANSLNSTAQYQRELSETESRLRDDKTTNLKRQNSLLFSQNEGQKQTNTALYYEVRNEGDMYRFFKENGMTTGAINAQRLLVELASGKISQKEAEERIAKLKAENKWADIKAWHDTWK